MINFKKIKKPLLIAEISANHNGSLKKAKQLITEANKFGADLVKIQTYEARNITIKSKRKEFKIKDGIWKNQYLWDLYTKGATPLNWQKKLFDHAKNKKINLFSSPFDEECVDILENCKCPIYKIASFEMNDFPLIKRISKTKKPVIISTGLSNLDEIKNTVNYAKKNGIKQIAILYCVSSYPAKNSDFNLNNITILKNIFKDCVIGLSDHSKDNDICKIAISLGAKIIEKHIALSDQRKGLDIQFSIKGNEIKKYKSDMLKSYSLIGKKHFFRSKSETKNKINRRSIYSIKKIQILEKFTKDNIKLIRPANGLSPENYFKIIGKRAKVQISAGIPIRKKFIKNF